MNENDRNNAFDNLYAFFKGEMIESDSALYLCNEFERDSRRYNRAFYEEQEVSAR